MVGFTSVPDFRKEVIVVLSEEHPEYTTAFTVPECLLVETSEFFKAACRNVAWLESTSRTIKLPEVEPDVFNAYLLWVHRKELPTAPSDDAFELIEDLVRLWLLAGRLADFRLRNAVIDAMLVELNSFTTSLNVFPPDLAAQVWSATTPGRSIKRLIIDYYAKHVGAATVQGQVADYHADFTRDLLVKAIEVVKNDEENICPSKRDSCFYHEDDYERVKDKIESASERERVSENCGNFPDFSQELTIVTNEDNPKLSQKFTVTQGFLTEHSAFFEAACRNGWEEATTRTIKLPDVDNGTFHAYLYWIHKEKIPFEIDCDPEGNHCSLLYDHEANHTLYELIELWLLADRLMTAKLRNAAADAILRVLTIIHPKSDMEDVFRASMIHRIWSATTQDRAIRRIVIDFYAFMVHPEIFESNMEMYDHHPDFVKDLALKGLSITHKLDKNQHPNERQEQQAGYYHELDKPHPRSNIHGTAEVSLGDKDGTVVRYNSTLFATPQEYIDAVYQTANRSQAPEVKVQIGNDVWATVKEDQWSESFGKIAESSHFERVSISISFDDCKFPEKLRLPGKRLRSC